MGFQLASLLGVDRVLDLAEYRHLIEDCRPCSAERPERRQNLIPRIPSSRRNEAELGPAGSIRETRGAFPPRPPDFQEFRGEDPPCPTP